MKRSQIRKKSANLHCVVFRRGCVLPVETVLDHEAVFVKVVNDLVTILRQSKMNL